MFKFKIKYIIYLDFFFKINKNQLKIEKYLMENMIITLKSLKNECINEECFENSKTLKDFICPIGLGVISL